MHEELDTRSRAILADVIRYRVDQGAFTTQNPDQTATMLAAVIDGLSIQLTLGAPHLDHEELLRLCDAAEQAQLGARAAVNARRKQ